MAKMAHCPARPDLHDLNQTLYDKNCVLESLFLPFQGNMYPCAISAL